MKRTWGGADYSTALRSDNDEGWVALELARRRGEHAERVARVVFWDAEGQFFLETFAHDVPLPIVEDMIAESKTAMKVR